MPRRATALSLRRYAPALSVALIEASSYAEPRLGETLPPIGRSLLEHLGVWDAFRAQAHQPVYGTAAAWGEPITREHPFIYTAHGAGWHLDRAAFDACLAREANARGVVNDRLVAWAQLFDQRHSMEPRTLVEAFRDGWWYTARMPGGQRIACCMTDSDIARTLHLHEPHGWCSLLATIGYIAGAVRDASPRGPLVARAVGSRRLDPSAGEGSLAVGDAASIFDPLSSQGIVKALRSGIFASYAIADLLTSRDRSGVKRYAAFVRAEFDTYTRTHASYYRAEQRWPESLFWRRRSAA
jgi:2-polyprenyl-6-methoxyphenol hydroxylase-like FAD-dependent oxidoreductase